MSSSEMELLQWKKSQVASCESFNQDYLVKVAQDRPLSTYNNKDPTIIALTIIFAVAVLCGDTISC